MRRNRCLSRDERHRVEFSASMKLFAALSVLWLLVSVTPVLAVSCSVAPPHPLSDAEQAFLRADYDKAATLYSQALHQTPNDSDLTAGLVQVLLKQEKLAEADTVLARAIAAQPKSVALQTALGFLQYREGLPQQAAATASAAMALDPCYGRLRLLNMKLLRLNSMFKTANVELKTGHVLDPFDLEISRYWAVTLPLQQRMAEMEKFLAQPNGQTEESLKRMRTALDALKKTAAEPHKSCQLVSSETSTDIPFAPIMADGAHIKAFGLDVKLNDHTTRLQIDTGAGGLLISRSVAKKAGLESFAAVQVGGIGDSDEKSAYSAYVDSIKIGKLEFHDCQVRVLDSREVAGGDGLIGMDVFASLLVTLDYPMRKLELAPLPAQEMDTAPGRVSLQTNAADNPAAGNVEEKPEEKLGQKPARGPHDRYVAPEMKDWTMVYRVGHNLIIPAALNDSKIKLFILDTGSSTTLISPQAAREVTKVHSDNYTNVRGISGTVDKVYEAGHFTLQFANMRQPVEEAISIDMSKLSANNGIDIAGLIGITTLGKLTVKIDYRDALVKFEYDPNRGYRSR